MYRFPPSHHDGFVACDLSPGVCRTGGQQGSLSTMQTPDVSELLSAASKVLPPEAVQAIQSLPEDQQLEALQRLLQQSEIDFGPLSAKHAKYLNRKSTEFGFLEGTLDLSRLGKDNCIAFGAFEDPDKPVAFLLAEVHPSSRSPVLSQKQTASALDALLGNPGAAQPGAAAVTLTALGVSYQYRRQGLASQLLGCLQEVAAQLGAVVILLMVLEANEGAAAFYKAAGYQDTGLSVDKDNGRYRVYGLPLQQQQQQQHEAEGDGAAPLVAGAATSQTQAAASSGMSKPSGSSSRGFGGSGGAKKGRKKARAVAFMSVACSRASASTQTHSSRSGGSSSRCMKLEDPWGLANPCSSRWPGHMAFCHVAPEHSPRPVCAGHTTAAGLRVHHLQQIVRRRQVMQLTRCAGAQRLGCISSSQAGQRQALPRWV